MLDSIVSPVQLKSKQTDVLIVPTSETDLLISREVWIQYRSHSGPRRLIAANHETFFFLI